MKKLCVGVLLVLALFFAQTAYAEPCGLCQAYYPCYWPCEHCVEGNGGPGLWEIGGGCWGEIVGGTCGDIGQCSGGFSAGGTGDLRGPSHLLREILAPEECPRPAKS
jgi:hypothetical protein